MSRWDTFKGWHGQESFWREIYARTVAGVATAAVIFLLAVASGYISINPRQVFALAVFFFGLVVNHLMTPNPVKRRPLAHLPIGFKAIILVITAVPAAVSFYWAFL